MSVAAFTSLNGLSVTLCMTNGCLEVFLNNKQQNVIFTSNVPIESFLCSTGCLSSMSPFSHSGVQQRLLNLTPS